MISYQEAIKYWRYNPITGIIYWICDIPYHPLMGKPAGSVNHDGYIVIGLHGEQYYAHRLAWLLHYGVWPDGDIDHEDHDKSHNWIENLRPVDQQTNSKNAGLSRRNKSGVTGVCWDKAAGKWKAQIKIEDRNLNLGTYEHFDDAVLAREEANRKYNYHSNHGSRRMLC